MKKIKSILSSYYLMGTLFLVLAFSMGIATFVENDFGTNAAKALIYDAWWFESLFVLLGINMCLNLLKPYMWSKGKLAVLLFHLSFVLIVLGAALTRYFGYEGVMHIREGESVNTFLSQEMYVDGYAEYKNQRIPVFQKVFFSGKSKDYFKQDIKVNGQKIKLCSSDFIHDAEFKVQTGESGRPMISLTVADSAGRTDVDLFYGEKVLVNTQWIGFGTDSSVDYQVITENGVLKMKTNQAILMKIMGQTQKASGNGLNISELKTGVVYNSGDLIIVLKKFYEHARLVPHKGGRNNKGVDVVTIQAAIDDNMQLLYLYGNQGEPGVYDSVSIGDVKIKLRFGTREMKTPFFVRLKDFKIERYPGSDSPSSFASEVAVKDKNKGIDMDFRIYMNHILNYRGYRFYQSSYDKDEKGTVLSVNHDFWGTATTYTGYFLLSVSMFLSLFARKSRFFYLAQKVKELGEKRRTLLVTLLFIVTGLTSYTQELSVDRGIVVTEVQAKQFGELWVQDNEGRIKPVNTLTGEILRKIVKHNSYKGYSSDRVVLSMMCNPEAWRNIPLITVKDEAIKNIIKNKGKKASYDDFFDAEGNYKLHEQVEKAFRTRPVSRSKSQNELLKVDEQVNVVYLALSGSLLNIFPVNGNEGAKWLLPGVSMTNGTEGDSLFVRSVFFGYIQDLNKGEDQEALKYLSAIKNYQKKYAANLLPSDISMGIEIIYNKSNLFLFLAPVLFVFGLVLLLLNFILLFKPFRLVKLTYISGNFIIYSGFIVYSVFLMLRAYLSGHAPWSDGYESMLYIGDVILLAGIILSTRSPIIIPIACLFSGVILFVAHLSWMNPEITPLVPVLKSYWLTIHVAIIIGSYGFLGLGSVIAFFNLILMGLQKDKNDKSVVLNIEQLSYIIEMGITVGVYLLTIGAFLGGVWANESWGRYWGWDPKETWSMVTILVFVFVLHMRFIPGLKSRFIFNVASLVGFFSILMTYLGVNYYLAGMHSYAKGDAFPIPGYVMYILLFISIVIVYAWFNQKRLYRRLKE